MFFLASPFVSDFLIDTAIRHEIPIVTEDALLNSIPKLRHADELGIVKTETDVPEKIIFNDPAALDLLKKQDKAHRVIKLADLLSNKFDFRNKLQSLNPNIHFTLIKAANLSKYKHSPIGYPCVIKPIRGISSMGVYKCLCSADWNKAMDSLKYTLPKNLVGFKSSAVDTESYLVESLIAGDEYAVDAYFDKQGNPIILGCYQHLFIDEYDISDQLYCTNTLILQKNLKKIEGGLNKLARFFNLYDFAVHAEIRIDENQEVQFIEVNPARFSGTDSPKLVYHFCKINPFEYFFYNIKPDWQQILNEHDNGTYSFLFFYKVNERNDSKQLFNIDITNISKQLNNLLEYTVHQRSGCNLIKCFFFTKSNSFSEAVRLSRLKIEDYV